MDKSCSLSNCLAIDIATSLIIIGEPEPILKI